MACARNFTLLAVAALSGCAPTARLQVFRPAVHDLAGVERIAILDGNPALADAGQVRQAVAESFAENRSYTLVEPAVLETVHPIRSPDGRTDRQAALDAARQVGVDALLACEFLPGGAVQAELLDTDSAAVLAASRAPSAQELVSKLAPHYEPVEITLARQWWGEGKVAVAAGNALARQGDWQAAAEKWEDARKANPGNHAALHNLALAAEGRRDYRTAFQLLDRALDQYPARLYHQTRKGMESRQTTFLLAAKQVDAIRAAALAHAGPPGVPAMPAGQASRWSGADDHGQAEQ